MAGALNAMRAEPSGSRRNEHTTPGTLAATFASWSFTASCSRSAASARLRSSMSIAAPTSRTTRPPSTTGTRRLRNQRNVPSAAR